jgi:hypothetical protein
VAAGTAAWTVPVIQTVAATPAYAQTQISPGADHSACVAACQAAVNQSDPLLLVGCQLHPSCEELCSLLCPNPTEGGLEGRPCINCAGAADPNTFTVANCSISACGERVEGKRELADA